MIELALFPKKFFGVEVPQDINERVLDFCKNVEYQYDEFPHPINTNVNLHKNDQLGFYVDFLNEQITLIKERQQLNCEKLSICSMWANKYTEHRMNARHNHPMFWWSFIHFLTEGSATYFFDHHAETPWMHMGEHNEVEACFKPGVNIPVGSILFFPSWVAHYVEPHTGPENRYSIAGNLFPEGSINKNFELNREYLNIKLV